MTNDAEAKFKKSYLHAEEIKVSQYLTANDDDKLVFAKYKNRASYDLCKS